MHQKDLILAGLLIFSTLAFLLWIVLPDTGVAQHQAVLVTFQPTAPPQERLYVSNGNVVQCQVSEQERLRIPQGSEVILEWIAPPDTDVVQYQAFWKDSTNHVADVLTINKWLVLTPPSDSSFCEVSYTANLPLGRGQISMIAIDRSGNKSEESDPFYYFISNTPPAAPLFVRIKIR